MGRTLRCWVGSYPPDGPGGAVDQGEGIWRVDLDGVTGTMTATLALPAPAPSYLLAHPQVPVLYAASETDPGAVLRLEVVAGGLREVERIASGGADPCHLEISADRRRLYVSNYSSGSLAVVTLAPDGSFSAEVRAAGGPVQVFPHSGHGPVPGRQEGPHVHAALEVGPEVLVADLGADALVRYRVAGDGLEPAGVAHAFPPGTGPRNLAHRDGVLYVVGELSVTLHRLAPGGDQAVAACGSPLASGRHVYPAEVQVHGPRILVSVRGADVLAEFADDGGLRHVADTPVGRWPRHFLWTPEWLVVAAQNQGRVQAVRAPGADDDASPIRTPLGARAGEAPGVVPAGAHLPGVDIPYPACVVMAP